VFADAFSIDLTGCGGESLGAGLCRGVWGCGQEGGFNVVPGHAWWQEDRDDVGCVVPWLKLLLDLIAGSVDGELVKTIWASGGMVPRRGLGRGFAARMAPTSVA